MLSESGRSRCPDELICLNRTSPGFRAIHRLIDDSQNFRSRIDAAELVGHRCSAGAIVWRIKHGSHRIAEAACVGSLVARLIPTPDQATRAFTSALSSVVPAVTRGMPKLIA